MKKSIFQSLKILLMLFVVLLVGVNANADIITYAGVEGGSGDVENVLFNEGVQVGPLVMGYLKDSGYIINFMSDEDLKASGGQATVEALDGSFDYLEIAMADTTLGFTKIQFNIIAEKDGFVGLTFMDQFDQGWGGIFDLDKNGNNKFTAIAFNDQVIVKAIIDSDAGIMTALSNVQQIRIGAAEINGGTDPQGDPVPEPATMLLFGSGLVGLAGLWRRSRKS